MSVLHQVVSEIENVISQVNEENLKASMSFFKRETPIFVIGEGRSGFQARSFAMRLMHIGYRPYVMGETITPALKPGNLFIAISGSGKTKNTLSDAQAAKKVGLKLIAVTSQKDSPLAHIADDVILVPGRTKGDHSVASIQLLSSLFDQSVHIVLDTLCLLLSRRDHVTDDDAAANHINVE